MKNLLLAIVLCAAAGARAQNPQTIDVWPNGPAASNNLSGPQVDQCNGNVTNISRATLTIFPAEGDRAIIVCPGGAYHRLALQHEGVDAARWFAQRGFTAAVLTYRMPCGNPEIPRADLLRAIEIMRSRGARKVGVAGFSAGGHLAAMALTMPDGEARRADFGILFYPVVTMLEGTHEGSRNALLGPDCHEEFAGLYSHEHLADQVKVPTLIVVSMDDRSVEAHTNGIRLHEAMQRAGAPSKLVTFPTGGHGWGWRNDFEHHNRMKAAVTDFMLPL